MATLAPRGDKFVEPPAPERPGPTTRRIEALDVVRGVALFGILLVNITGFGLADAFNPANSGGAQGANLWAWIITQMGFEGTQRGLFSLLFGASAILLTSRLEAAGRVDAADIYFRRNLWLIAFGFVNAFVFLWYGDILYAYGVIALFVFAFRKLAPGALLALGVGALLLGTLWTAHDSWQLLDKHSDFVAAEASRDAGDTLSAEQEYAITAWDQARSEFESSPERIAEAVQARTGGYARAFGEVAQINVYWQTWGLYRYFFDIFGMMLIGMALFRLGVLTLERPTRLYLFMVVAGYGVGLVVNYFETRWIIDHRFSAVAFAQANISYDLGRLAMTIGHLGALLLFVRSGWLPWLRRALAAVGRMAVTNYLSHSVICAILFVGLGWFGQLERHELYGVVFAIWALQLVLSPLWLRYFRFGPVEWLWRWLTYLERPPLRRPAVTPAGLAVAAA
ncbi:DUF418 domain-containing protein [Sphingosinicella sp. CPCC 101087]|uniref:DUF418 domain-containing protein n=1 Tax=Sphingosinicella sp. CPCC 101087 TaxID=2497754 RepID=UPI00101C96FA|nr:DUF418 domain-containing protein [Sphingosinicella sp. CPCC 101087]